MRKTFDIKLERGRLQDTRFSTPLGAPYGAFMVQVQTGLLRIIVSDGKGDPEPWEHVSVSLANRCPNWPEMSLVKSWVWEPTETVVQFHPPESEYVNNHRYCLHMWKPPYPVVLPPSILVGIKALGEINEQMRGGGFR